MKIEYILIKDKNDFCPTIASFKSWLSANSRVDFISDKKVNIDEITFDYDLKQSEVEHSDESVFWLTVRVDSDEKTPNDKAVDLQKADDILHRINEQAHLFNINIVWDDISSYYAKELYPKISELENEIRKVIYVFMMKTVGKEWLKRYTPKEVQKSIKDNAQKREGKENLVECQLNYADFIDLILFFTKPYSLKDNYQEMICKLKQEESYSGEIVKHIIEEYERKSNWDRYFSEITELENLDEKGSALYLYRNAVAHNKYIREKDYDKAISLITEVKSAFDKCLEYIDKLELNDSQSTAIEAIANETISPIMPKVTMLSEFANYLGNAFYLQSDFGPNIASIIKNVSALYKSFDVDRYRDGIMRTADITKEIYQRFSGFSVDTSYAEEISKEWNRISSGMVLNNEIESVNNVDRIINESKENELDGTESGIDECSQCKDDAENTK